MLRRAFLVALASSANALLPGLPKLETYLDLRMTVRTPRDAMQAIGPARPDGIILWEGPGPDWSADLGVDVLAVDPGDRNIEGLATHPRRDPISLFEPPFDPEELISACTPGRTLLLDSTADVWKDETLPLVEVVAAAAVDTARVLVSLYDTTMLQAC
eukprot:CAMPEP_0119286918 /NCGR_PEP_ID=MMETSP1329-20130426/34700_1 /TAXON_ID=114041 /ORGANISM="Genus nov. species nov., Strain RCC1024" /LENGTH=157 /DNA_ID=CAMNT_0007287663 /DNA_START=80 /DNA_END=550 /DNA_ORIENTATION=-